MTAEPGVGGTHLHVRGTFTSEVGFCVNPSVDYSAILIHVLERLTYQFRLNSFRNYHKFSFGAN